MPIYKDGLLYYSHDIGMTRDKKLRKIRIKYGSTGVDVWLAVLDLIYGDKGYYIKYGNADEKESVIWGVLDYVKGKYAPDAETVGEIIEALAACELFSGDLLKRGILSSLRIQTQYYLGTVERKTVTVIPEYWLLSVEKMKKLSGRSSILRQFNNQPIIPNNQPIIPNNQPIIEQRKVKESKVKESKVVCTAPPETTAHTNTYGTYGKVKLTEKEYAVLVDEYGKNIIDECINKIDIYIKNNNIKPFDNHFDTIKKWLKDDGVQPKSAHSYDLDKIYAQIINYTPKID